MTELPEHPGSITVEDSEGKELTTCKIAVATEVREDGEVIVSLSGPLIHDAEYRLSQSGTEDEPWDLESIDDS